MPSIRKRNSSCGQPERPFLILVSAHFGAWPSLPEIEEHNDAGVWTTPTPTNLLRKQVDMYGTFHSVLTNAQLPQSNSGSPGDVWWVNATGLLWFIAGDGSLIQLLASVPIPTIGPQGPQGNPGPQGPAGPVLMFQGNWNSKIEYAVGSIVSANNNLFLANVLNIDNFPPSNPFWDLLGSLPTQVSELIIAIDGGNQNPSLGFHGYIPVPFDCTITGWTLLGDQSGSAALDVKWSTFANLPATISITAGAGPTLTAAQKASGTVSGWSPVSFNQSDIIEVDLISASGALTFLTLSLQIEAT
jgi:hypothetical protein